ncbi:MAG: leucyl aminopeptidase [Planctomycetota bacterium]|nr:leucyl aminopeptidase [Planctomycetota bacterium]
MKSRTSRRKSGRREGLGFSIDGQAPLFRAVGNDEIGRTARPLVVFVTEDGGVLGTGLPQSTMEALTKELHLAQAEQFKGKEAEIHVRHTQIKGPTRVIFAGVGKLESFGADFLRRAAGSAAKRARDTGSREIVFVVPAGAGKKGQDIDTLVQSIVEGATLGAYRYAGHKKPDKKTGVIARCLLALGPRTARAGVNAAIHRGVACAEAVMQTRDLTNEPANFMNPTRLAQAASVIARRSGLRFRMMSRAQLERLGMGALLGVSRGSAQPPTLSILEYRPRAGVRMKKDAPFKRVALVGKGLTFDSGGISLKPADGMQHMKNDMAGAAAVIAAMGAIGRLRPNLHVLGIIPATENMPSGTATKPGDVLYAMTGKTIEVTNTDAEGRLVLADAVAYAEKLGAEAIVDTATLTGAASVALGPGITALLGNDQPLIESVKAAAEAAGEKVWQLPLHEEYKELLKSDYADIKNADMRPAAGTIKGALFIAAFVDKAKWAHLDIAATAFTDKDHPLGPVGATGVITRTLINWVLQT